MSEVILWICAVALAEMVVPAWPTHADKRALSGLLLALLYLIAVIAIVRFAIGVVRAALS